MTYMKQVSKASSRVLSAVTFKNVTNRVLAHVLSHLVFITFFFFLVLAIQSFFGNVSGYGLFDLWETKGTFTDWFYACWFIFAWVTAITAYQCFSTVNKPEQNRHAEHILRGGVLLSLSAGVLEEILFRWIWFMAAIIFVKVGNFLFFDFLGFGIAEFLHNWILGPVANFFTFGALSEYLTNPEMWAVGAGLIAANSKFRDGHKYQGPIGWINSWFIGMVMFYLTLEFGLIAAIVMHFLYDFVIDIIVYVDMLIERAMGRR